MIILIYSIWHSITPSTHVHVHHDTCVGDGDSNGICWAANSHAYRKNQQKKHCIFANFQVINTQVIARAQKVNRHKTY
jgi:hypothetical protein